MTLVWDCRILCDKVVCAFNWYAISRSHLYFTNQTILQFSGFSICKVNPRFPKIFFSSAIYQTGRSVWAIEQLSSAIGGGARAFFLPQKKFCLGVRFFCEWRHKWSSFRVIFAHVAWPRAQPLGQSVSLKFSLETRLESEYFEPLIDFTFLVQKLWSKINKLIN